MEARKLQNFEKFCIFTTLRSGRGYLDAILRGQIKHLSKQSGTDPRDWRITEYPKALWKPSMSMDHKTLGTVATDTDHQQMTHTIRLDLGRQHAEELASSLKSYPERVYKTLVVPK